MVRSRGQGIVTKSGVGLPVSIRSMKSFSRVHADSHDPAMYWLGDVRQSAAGRLSSRAAQNALLHNRRRRRRLWRRVSRLSIDHHSSTAVSRDERRIRTPKQVHHRIASLNPLTPSFNHYWIPVFAVIQSAQYCTIDSDCPNFTTRQCANVY